MSSAGRAPVASAVVALSIVLLFVAGLLTTLFGPAPGRLLGVFAFPAALILLLRLGQKQKRGELVPLIAFNRGVLRYRPTILAAIVVCLTVAFACVFVGIITSVTFGPGVPDNRPVFEDRNVYKLYNHGAETVVSRRHYLIRGTMGAVAWHAGTSVPALLALYLALYGEWPGAMISDETHKSS